MISAVENEKGLFLMSGVRGLRAFAKSSSPESALSCLVKDSGRAGASSLVGGSSWIVPLLPG